MPLVAETAPKRRRRPWGWLALPLLPALLVIFVVVTTLTPWAFECGGQVVEIYGTWSGAGGLGGHSGWHRWDRPSSSPVPVGVGLSTVTGVMHDRWLILGSWGYGVKWFKGHRMKP